MLDKLYTWSSDEAAQDIIDIYTSQWYCIVNYLYFANAMKWRLFEKSRNQHDVDYKTALEQWDFLLPDGIALQTFYEYSQPTKQQLHNVNWTDFLPYFLNFLKSREKSLCLYIYGSKPEYIQEIHQYFIQQWYDVRYILDGYQELHWDEINTDSEDINILLVGRWTPLQEMRVQQHIDTIKKKWLLVMNQWWTFDFLVWVEKRAPNLIIKSRVLETPWRVLTNPKKNLWKFLAMFGVFRYFFSRK